MKEKKQEVLILGGGVGGLLSACLLCKENFRPIIVEQHYRIGGGLHSFSRHGVSFDAGIHYVSGFEKGGTLQKIFSYLGFFDKLKIKELDKDGFDVLHIDSENLKVKFGIGKENFIRILSEQFPQEANAIKAYVGAIYNICSKIPLFNLKATANQWYLNEETLTPVTTYIESFIKDKQLQLVLAWNNTLYGGIKDSTPIYIHAIITKFYIEGASRFVGGSQHVVDEMIKMIKSHGGSIFLKTDIKKIEVENKRITKIIASDGREFSADYYISSIHPALLMDLIETDQLRKAYKERLKNLRNTYSTFITFVHFKPQSFPYMNHNYYYYKNNDLIWNIMDYDINNFPSSFMFMTHPVHNQTEYAEKAVICSVMRYEDFLPWENTNVGKRGKEYKQLKKQIENQLVDLIDGIFPDFKKSIQHIYSGTPLTIRDYLRTKNGAMYGYVKNSENMISSHLLPRTRIENLFLTGQNLNLHGMLGVPLSAIATVGEIVGGIDIIIDKINKQNN